MDKRDLSLIFADRLRQLVDREPGGLSAFARATGLDRSALSQFLAPGSTRLPRAEALRRIAAHAKVSADWLLGLSFSEEAARQLSATVDIEEAESPDGDTPIARWHREAAGHKIRYVPAFVPDQLSEPEILAYIAGSAGGAAARQAQAAATLGTVILGDTDLEIAMPLQTLEDISAGTGHWRGLPVELRRRQLERMASLTAAHYPMLRLHLYDGRRHFAAPFTVFGPPRAALYLGPGYLVLTGAEDVRRLARIFDGLVRVAVIGADLVSGRLATLAGEAR
ncbi:MAG: transcriptional regulator [Pseudomonadota bacterium]